MNKFLGNISGKTLLSVVLGVFFSLLLIYGIVDFVMPAVLGVSTGAGVTTAVTGQMSILPFAAATQTYWGYEDTDGLDYFTPGQVIVFADDDTEDICYEYNREGFPIREDCVYIEGVLELKELWTVDDEGYVCNPLECCEGYDSKFVDCNEECHHQYDTWGDCEIEGDGAYCDCFII